MIRTISFPSLGCLILLASCASVEPSDAVSTQDLRVERENIDTVRVANDVADENEDAFLEDSIDVGETLRYGQIPRISQSPDRADDATVARPSFSGEEIEVSLTASQPITEFVDVVYGDLLGTGYILGPGVEANPGVVNFRSKPVMSRAELYEDARTTLALNGLNVLYEDGNVKIVENSSLREAMPRFITSRGRQSVPTGLQPVVQFVEIYARDLNEMVNTLRLAFPDRNVLTIEANRTTNSLMIAGLPNDVSEGLSIIRQLDELKYAGADYAVYRARNWSAEELSSALESFLRLNGYSVTSQAGATTSINLLPIPFTQQIYIFARRPEFLEYAVDTIQKLDRDAAPQNALSTRVYKAKHYKAEELVTILDRVSQLRSGANASLADPLPASAGGAPAAGSPTSANFVVDEQGNRVIFEATNEEYAEIIKLLRQIDVPAAEVLIEVTIAEITLTDDRRTGVELLFQQIGSRGFAVGLGTQGLGLSDGGLSGGFQSGDYVVDFSALATNNQVNVLSTPRIVTKSGSDASIQVGTDVPIILSQSAGISQSGGTTDILQSVQYRETGIILNITPLVLSGDRIDLTVSQEVSAAEANANQAIASPIISNRSLQTELTLQDGQSAILGGLIENRYTRGTSGVPVLKDIPILGSAFNTETLNSTRTVLMVMITPYILETRADRADVVDDLVDIVNDAFMNQVQDSETLRKPKTPLQVAPQHADEVHSN